MTLHKNSQLLVSTLESLPLLDGRFSNIKLANWSTGMPMKRGCFSLVFRAHDEIAGKPVAIKFMDIDPKVMTDGYRQKSFVRENDILELLRTKERCLQLVKSLSTYNLAIPSMPGILLPCRYFAVDWLSDDIDRYFFDVTIDPAVRLQLFNEVVLAVEALHRAEVFHRDLKADNLRAVQDATKRIVVAIDLGTAARFDSDCIAASYGHSAGAPVYSAPEAIAGLAGNRILAPFTDIYALGCLLFELFSVDHFFRARDSANPNYGFRLAAMAAALEGITDEKAQIQAWKKSLALFGAGVVPVCVDGPGSGGPPSICGLLNEIVAALTHFDFQKRPGDLSWVRQKIWIAIKVLRNAAAQQKRIEQQRLCRQYRMNKARARDARFNTRRALPC